MIITDTDLFAVFFKVGEVVVSNYGHLMSTQGNFQIKLPVVFILQMK